jgi:hypothetical protein
MFALRSPGAGQTDWRDERVRAESAVLRGTPAMELGGLEPPTSWVRFGRPIRSSGADLHGCVMAGQVQMPAVARDSRELGPPNRLSGLKRTRGAPGGYWMLAGGGANQ